MRWVRRWRGRYARIVLFAYFGGGILWLGGWILWEYARWAHYPARQRALQQEILRAWGELEDEVRRRAEAFARHPVVRRGLQADTGALVRWVESLDWEEELWSLDVLDAQGRELAWRGHRMPLSEEANGPLQTEVIVEPGRRVYLVVVRAVEVGGRLAGWVRIGRLLRSWLPVQNAYIWEYDWAARWRQRLNAQVAVDWHGSLSAPEGLSPGATPLRLRDGRPVGVLYTPYMERPPFRLPCSEREGKAWLLLWILGGGVLWGILRWGAGRRWDQGWRAFVYGSLLWWALRWALLGVPWPGSWFQPGWLGSGALGPLSRSLGDVLLSAFFAFLWALALWRLVPPQILRPVGRLGSIALGLAGFWVGMLWVALGELMERLAVDSTLTYFSLQGLFPSLPVFGLYVALALLGATALLVGFWPLVSLDRQLGHVRPSRAMLSVGAGLLMPVGFAPSAWRVYLAFCAAVLILYGFWRARAQKEGFVFRFQGMPLRILFLTSVGLTVALYPLWLRAVRAQWQVQMQELAQRLVRQEDRWTMFTLEEVLRQLQNDAELVEALRRPGESVDSLLAERGIWTLLRALRGYEVDLRIYDLSGRSRNRPSLALVLIPPLPERLPRDWMETYSQQPRRPDPWVYVVRGRAGMRERYEGVAPVLTPDRRYFVGWALVRAFPGGLSTLVDMPLPRVLVRREMHADWQSRFAVAVFRDGWLLRSRGEGFIRYRLQTDLAALSGDRWLLEREGERSYWTLYRPSEDGRLVAVRIETPAGLLHLFFGFQLWPPTLFVAFLGLVFFFGGFRSGGLWRYRRFRDRLFDAVLLLSLLTFLAVGGVAYRIIRQQSVEQLKQQVRTDLETIQAYLERSSGWEQGRWRLPGAQLDSLAQLLDADINLYREARLEATTRPIIFQYHLLDDRLPLAIYRALYEEGQLEVFSPTRIGRFAFWTGYRLLYRPDGSPRGVVAVPTLPRQPRLELQLASTMAYLIGAYAAVLFLVAALVGLLSGAIAAPLRRLRAGLERVARGRLDEPIAVETEDELGDLVRSYNEMLAELDRSQKVLTRQAQELAWREMARQVAHEIKNPLTPMKLTLQYLERAYRERKADFDELFARTVRVLLEQIETLNRIASEFSHFARMSPSPLEPLDLRQILQEAAELFQTHPRLRLLLCLPEEPQIVEAGREDLRRVFVNLLQNAVQAMPRGGKVQIQLERLDGRIRVAISDTGPGIPEEIRDKLFLPNFSTKSSGMGLGLAIVRKTVEDLGGRVYFETEEGKGTTFYVELPLREGVSESAYPSQATGENYGDMAQSQPGSQRAADGLSGTDPGHDGGMDGDGIPRSDP